MKVRQKQDRGEPMTIIVGVICKDGIVLGCDSQASSAKGVPVKRTDYTKIYEIPLGGDGYAILSGAGTGAFITRASELLEDRCKNIVCKKPREFADICEDVVTELFKRYVVDRTKVLGLRKTKMPQVIQGGVQWQEDPLESPGIVLLTGIQCGDAKNPNWCLYTVHPDGIAEKDDKYDAIGSGSAIAEYLLARLCSETLDVDQATKVVVYVVEEVKKIDPFCGGPTKVVALSKNGVKRLNPQEVKEIADFVMGQDENLAEFWRSLILSSETSHKDKVKARD